MDLAEPPLLTRFKLTVDDYYRMAEVGILQWNSRVELIEGEIIEMAPIGSDHSGTVIGLNRALMRACGDLATVSVQGPVRVSNDTEPQPDFLILKPRDDDYRTAHPTPADTLLVIEVADSSLRYDRRVKRPIYARSGIPEYWIVDLKERRVDSYSDPSGDTYSTERTYRPGDSATLAADPRITITLDRIL